MKERGLTFCQELVPRVLDGSKFVTRRLGGLKEINENPDNWLAPGDGPADSGIWEFRQKDGGQKIYVRCRQGVAGDRFYMQEAWGLLYPGYHVFNHCAALYDAWNKAVEETANRDSSADPLIPVYKVDHVTGNDGPKKVRWRSGRFQPKWACRPQRWEFVSIRPERLQDITEEEIIAEGIRPMGHREGNRVKILMRLSGKYPPGEYLNEAQDNVLEALFISTWNLLNAKRGYAFERNNWVWREEWNPKPVEEVKE